MVDSPYQLVIAGFLPSINSMSDDIVFGILQVQGLMQWEFSAIIEASSCHHQSETKIGWDRNVDLKMMVFLEVGSR